MTKPKPLEQLRAEKERAETQLAQEQHKLERLENRKKYLEQCVQAAISTETKKDYAAQRGRDAFGTATRISASLLRRLSAFFRSVSDQDPKAAKFAVLNPGHAGFPKRVERSEGSNSAPIRNAPCFAV